MPGPAPVASPRRRNVRPDAAILPASGYVGPVPEWPLAVALSVDEEVAWRWLWRTPQAAAWAQMAIERTVARYCRVLVTAETPGAKAVYLAEARQLEDRLGMTPMAMLRLRWQVAEGEIVPLHQVARDRGSHLVAVDSDA